MIIRAVAAANRFIQHGLASAEGLSLRAWRSARQPGDKRPVPPTRTRRAAISASATTTAIPLRRSLRLKSKAMGTSSFAMLTQQPIVEFIGSLFFPYRCSSAFVVLFYYCYFFCYLFMQSIDQRENERAKKFAPNRRRSEQCFCVHGVASTSSTLSS